MCRPPLKMGEEEEFEFFFLEKKERLFISKTS